MFQICSMRFSIEPQAGIKSNVKTYYAFPAKLAKLQYYKIRLYRVLLAFRIPFSFKIIFTQSIILSCTNNNRQQSKKNPSQ